MTNLTPDQMESRIVRYGDLRPCRTAFIDAHTPGSNQKENFTIIGGGVSESAEQHVHIGIAYGMPCDVADEFGSQRACQAKDEGQDEITKIGSSQTAGDLSVHGAPFVN